MKNAGHGPLAAFTSLAIAGSGLVAASAVAELAHAHRAPVEAAAGALLLATGLAVSLGHLGRKSRAFLALRGVGRSALSNEVLIGGLALAAAVLAAGFSLAGRPWPAATAAAGAANAVFLLSVGVVYRIRGQRTWQGISTITPFMSGLAFGAIGVASTAQASAVTRLALILVATDALVLSQRWRAIAAVASSGALPRQGWRGLAMQLLGARFFLFDVMPFFLLASSHTTFAMPIAAAGLLVDRFGFYALALQHTTEDEIDHVDRRIAALDDAALK
jgi:DMSO reductase anchor subunit